MARRSHTDRFLLLLLVAAYAIACLALSPQARGVTLARPLVTLSDDTSLKPATYTIGNFKTTRDEWVYGYTLTFQSDTDASAAVAGNGDVVSCPDGRTVTVTFDAANRIPPRTNNFDLILSNIVNPSAVGTYEILDVTFHTMLVGVPADVTVSLGGRGTYVVTPPPYLSMTITTPDGGQTVDFGVVDPGVTTAPKVVSIAVDSGADYSIQRTFTDTGLGLAVTGDIPPAGTVVPTGAFTYTDSYTASPPWTTDPGVPLSVPVTYTVLQY